MAISPKDSIEQNSKHAIFAEGDKNKFERRVLWEPTDVIDPKNTDRISDPGTNNLKGKLNFYHGSNLSGFKNYTEICEEKLPILTVEQLQEQPKITLFKSACGTGKNYRLNPLIKEYAAAGKRIVIVVPRRALSKTTSRNTGLPCYQEIESGGIHGSVVICLDSIPRVRCDRSKIDLLILDEAAQLAQHSFGGTIRTQNNVDKIHKHMQYLFKLSDKIIAQDADLDSETTRHILSWDENREYTYQVIVNTAMPFVPETIMFPNEDQFWFKILHTGAKDGKIWEFCSSAKQARVHGEMFKQNFPDKNVLVVYQAIMGEPHIQECLNDTRKFDEYDAVFASPSIQTGISIESKNTWHVFGFIRGLGASGPTLNDAHQGLNRVRNPVDNKWNVFVRGQTATTNQSVEEIIDDYTYVSEKTNEFLKGISFYPHMDERNEHKIKTTNDEMFLRAADLKAREYRYGGKFDDCFDDFKQFVPGAFRKLWQEKGFVIKNQGEINCIEAFDFRTTNEQLEEQDIQDIIDADIITKEEAEEESKKNLTKQKHDEIELARIRDFYDIKDEEKPNKEQVEEYVHQGRTKLTQFAETVAYQNDHKKELAAQDIKKLGCDIHSKHVCAKAELLDNFLKTIDVDLKSTIDRINNGEDIDEIQKEFNNKPIKTEGLSDNYEDYRRIFGMRITGGKEMNIVRSILSKIGLKFNKGRQINKKYQYHFDVYKLKKYWELSKPYYDRLTNPNRQLDLIKNDRPSTRKYNEDRSFFRKNLIIDHDLDSFQQIYEDDVHDDGTHDNRRNYQIEENEIDLWSNYPLEEGLKMQEEYDSNNNIWDSDE